MRKTLIELQRKMAKGKNVVMEGRDIGTNVFPNADVKFYLTASANERIRRRVDELNKSGKKYDFNEIAESVYTWDSDAVNRSQGALKKAKDCIEIDTTELTVDELIEVAVRKIRERYVEEREI